MSRKRETPEVYVYILQDDNGNLIHLYGLSPLPRVKGCRHPLDAIVPGIVADMTPDELWNLPDAAVFNLIADRICERTGLTRLPEARLSYYDPMFDYFEALEGDDEDAED